MRGLPFSPRRNSVRTHPEPQGRRRQQDREEAFIYTPIFTNDVRRVYFFFLHKKLEVIKPRISPKQLLLLPLLFSLYLFIYGRGPGGQVALVVFQWEQFG